MSRRYALSKLKLIMPEGDLPRGRALHFLAAYFLISAHDMSIPNIILLVFFENVNKNTDIFIVDYFTLFVYFTLYYIYARYDKIVVERTGYSPLQKNSL